ncbi:MAG: hypothetical protein V2J24_11810 [Pseudomonadales bacterium]|jgi:hypothetical protein|nr:hypothetical protein [Pseudomonadales bacterium]
MAGRFGFTVFRVCAIVARNGRFRVVFAVSASTWLGVRSCLFHSTIE